MSDTIIDIPKVTQMLDAGWHVRLFKNPMGSYTAIGRHLDHRIMERTRQVLIELTAANDSRAQVINEIGQTVEDWVDDFHFDDDWLCTDDFTPEQALTRLAYKAVGGEII